MWGNYQLFCSYYTILLAFWVEISFLRLFFTLLSILQCSVELVFSFFCWYYFYRTIFQNAPPPKKSGFSVVFCHLRLLDPTIFFKIMVLSHLFLPQTLSRPWTFWVIFFITIAVLIFSLKEFFFVVLVILSYNKSSLFVLFCILLRVTTKFPVLVRISARRLFVPEHWKFGGNHQTNYKTTPEFPVVKRLSFQP